ncbi:MAG: hypothetical protein KDK08_08300, partial [Rhizobiaceae bacterium]|nr:hypothetical protein [Rhizobiaceae bacterium]
MKSCAKIHPLKVALGEFDGSQRLRQAQAVAKAKAKGRYPRRPPDKKRNTVITDMLKRGMIYQDATGASRASVAKIAKRRASRNTLAKGRSLVTFLVTTPYLYVLPVRVSFLVRYCLYYYIFMITTVHWDAVRVRPGA